MNEGTKKALLWGAAGLGAFFAVRSAVQPPPAAPQGK